MMTTTTLGLRRWPLASASMPLLSRRATPRALLSTVVDEEVRKFNRVSSDWWAPESASGVGPLHQLNPVRVKYIRAQTLAHFGRTAPADATDPLPLAPYRVADVGCGGGILSEALSRLGGSLVSVDPGEGNIAAARSHAQHHARTRTIDYRCGTSEDLVAAGETFDVVCSLEVIEHVSDPRAFIRSLTPLVKPGGLLFLSTINRTLLSGALAIGMAEYVMRIVPPGTHDWQKFLQPTELVQFLREEQMTVKDVSGIVGNPIQRNWRLDPNCTDVNYILCAAKPAATD